jgi:hypothetical protein
MISAALPTGRAFAPQERIPNPPPWGASFLYSPLLKGGVSRRLTGVCQNGACPPPAFAGEAFPLGRLYYEVARGDIGESGIFELAF